MIEETLEKILHTLEKCCKKTHQSNKSESGENKSKISSQEATSIKEKLSEVLSIDKQYIFDLSDKKTLEIIKEKEDFRQRDELFSDNEKWYLIYDKGGSKIDISLSYDRIKSIPSNIIFNNCNIDLYMNKPEDAGKDNIETIKNHLYFYNCTFEKVLIKLKNIIFEKTLTFDQCAFYNDLKIYQNQFLDHLVFLNCYDKQNDIKITSLDLQENKFEGYLFIKNCAIKNINLWKNKFENRCYFVDSKFEYENKDNTTKLNCSNTHFEDEVYFNNSEFYSYADFHECKFDNTACFYGVKFYKVPNFSACYFKEQKAANLINVDIDELNFESVEKYIEDNYQDETYENKQEVIEEQRNNSCKLKCAKHLKDSFRVIKDVLISQNNILEAQEWHKLELYAKEKELEIKLNNNNDNLKKEYKNQIYNPKDYEKVDFSRFIYLLKIFGLLFINILIFVELILIVPFFVVMFYCVYIGLFVYKILMFTLKSFYPLNINKFKIFWKTKFNHIIRKLVVSGRKMLDYTLWFDCVLLQIYRNTSNHHTNFLKILNFTILMIVLYAIFGLLLSSSVNFILSFEPIQIAVTGFIVFFILLATISSIKKQLYLYGIFLFFIIFGVFIMAIVTFFSSVYIEVLYFLIYFTSVVFFYILFTCKIKIIVFIVRAFAYVGLIGVIVIKPQLINPFAGVFSSDKLYDSKLEKKLSDLNATAIMVLAGFSQGDFNLPLKDQKISFTELNSAKTFVIANKVKLKEILSKVYDDKYESTYKKVLGELENNTSNIKNIIKAIDNNNNNSVASTQLYKFIKSDFTHGVNFLYAVKDVYSISVKLLPEQLAIFEQKDSQDKLKNILSLLKFKSSFEEILNFINQDEITSNVIKSTSVLYSIILLLCIFSLQKTARKNSIVPS